MNYRMMIGATLVAASAMLAGCGDKPDTAASAQPSQSAAEQQQIEKYNQYVDVANSLTTSFQEARENYVTQQMPLLQGKEAPTSMRIENDILVDRSAKQLDAAAAIDTPIVEIDAAAKDFSAALKVLSPLSHELNNYANSKGYLADNGDKARQLSKDYVAALTLVAQKEQAFYKGLSDRDQALTKEAFDKAPKDTAAYYRAGVIYYGKVNNADANVLFAAPNDPKALDAFEKSLAQVAYAAAGWDKKVTEQSAKSGKSCNGGMLEINDFLGQSRSLVKDIKDGVFKREETGIMARMSSSNIVNSANRYNSKYSNVIDRFNHPLC
ncbi:DUF3829 domain-containing protein [Pseudomonas nunensis]|uniref:YiiG family protein n=1 Tax=Pseudomonas nunensis TaxID=2961896 RepID=A0ABY5EL47_9PSED|nr:DUF3829 domain-containing protein [Pseudomonas nunensis]KPN93956.1 hypothetical protein AL066_03590 [Pseudomonas nunensis]MCL5230455.1 YiiG family protein [Pseudomonas nunensis]UTO15477.1 YiiG family protein [Pseudomonas nunensis]